MPTYFIYIVECSDHSYYTGVTNNLEVRISQHNEGLHKTAYTYTRRPVRLVYWEQYSDIKVAIAREKQLKGWSRKKKSALIAQDMMKLSEYSRRRLH